MGAHMRCVIPSNCLEIPASPLLQDYGQERAHEAENEAEEPDRVDKYCRCRGDKRITEGYIQKSIGVAASRVGKLLGYLCKEGLSDYVGILLQALVADGNESSHRR